MPDPSTTRLALYKSKSDGSEDVNYTQDLGQNWDKVDTAVGYQAVTSSTRPSAPYSGKPIMQTDTAYSTYVSNGTSPASGSWVEIPNSSAVYGGRFISLFTGSTSAASLMRLAQTGPASGSRAFATRGATDTADHFFFDFDGRMQWSAGGSAAGDTNLYRSAANVLKTDDAFQALSVAGIQVPTTIVKTTTTSRTSTTTLADDPDFTATLGTGTYQFEMMLQCTGAALGSGDIKALIKYSGTVTSGTWQGVGMSTSGATNIQNNGGSVVSSSGVSQPFGVSGASFSGVLISGGLVAGSSGTLSLQWAQNTSSATATNVRLGSWFRITQIA
jgi:hypothetical protein